MNIEINQEFKALIRPLSLEEYSQLEKNIIADGCREPLVLWRPESIACPECAKGSMIIGEHEFETLSNELDKWITESEECWVCKDCDYTKNIHDINSILMDGHNRYEICAKNNIGFDVSYKYFTDSSHAKEWMILNQFGRRNLINYQRSVLALELESGFSERAKENQAIQFKGNSLCQTSDKVNPIDTKKELAKVAKVSHDTIAKVKKIQSTATQEVKDKLESGEVSINQAYKDIKKVEARVERANKIVEISQGNQTLEGIGKFPVIYADPPWRYEFAKTENREIENHYPTMQLDDICNMDISQISTDDSVLFMWATSPKLEEALRVINAWGFSYVTCAIWDKEKIGMGYYFRQQHELLLVAKKGNIPAPIPAARVKSVLSYKRGEHSSKPEEFYLIIEDMYPEYKKLELFCRSPRVGWSVWGNQSNG